jgi:HAE1 family hydrophobic/amphiphilic exporter-1
MWLTRLAVSRPITVTMALVSLLVIGAISLSRLPLSFLPQAEFPFIGVQIPYANGVPEQVERDITRPIEEVLATLGGVQEIFSQSDADGSFVGVTFAWGREVDILRMEVKEKIDQIRPELPEDVRDIFLMTFNTNDIPVVEGRISAKDLDLSENYTLIEQRVMNRLQRVPGVGRVSVNGVEPPDVTVWLHLDRIKEHQVDVGRLFELLRTANLDLSAGQVTRQGLRYTIRAGVEFNGWEELQFMPINDRGLVLGDIADVDYGTPLLTYGRFLNLEPAVAFEIQKSSGANTVQVVARVKQELELINSDPALEGIEVVMFFDQGEQITHSLKSLLSSGLIGAIMAIAVLYFFLRNLVTTLITSMAIPISIVATCTYMYFSGHSLNVLSMMGLMLGVGMLIDNAVVVLEAIYRRMQLGEGAVEATLKGTKEVGRAVISATLTSVVVFAPIVLGSGSELVVWLKEIGLTISITLLASLLVSLTIIPVLTAHLMRNRRAVGTNPIVDGWRERYGRVLEWTAIRHPWITSFVFVPIAIALTVGLVVVTGFGVDSMEERGIRQEFLQVNYDFADDVDYRTSRTTVEAVQKILWEKREDYKLRYLYSFYMDGHAANRLYFEETSISPGQMREYRERLREDLPSFAGVEFRLGNEDGGGGGAKAFSVTLHGEDSGELSDLAREVKRRFELLDGIEDVTTDEERGNREVHVHVDGESARRLGVDPRTVAEVMGITFRGVPLPRLPAASRELDFWVVLREEDRRNVDDLRSLTVSVQDGTEITLGQLASMELGRGASRISRQDQRTAVRVRGSYAGDDFDEALSDVSETMDQMVMPAGYGWNFGSSIQQAREQEDQMGLNALLALACVYMIMASLFESLRHPAVVMSCVPFAGIGVVWLMIATNTPLNILAMIGIVILIGIVVNNGIVLVDHINHHRRQGLDLDESIRRGGRERFRPILMTATTTVLGLLPLALGDSHVGNGELYPMATALMGGLISSTALTLVLLPTYYRLSEIVDAWSRRRVAAISRWRPQRRGFGSLLRRARAH